MNHKGSNSVVCIFAAIPSGGQPGFKNWALFGGKSNKKSKKGFPFETIKRSRMTLLSLCLKKAFLFLFFFFFFLSVCSFFCTCITAGVLERYT